MNHRSTTLDNVQSFDGYEDTFDNQLQLNSYVDHIHTLYRYGFDVVLSYELFHVLPHYEWFVVLVLKYVQLHDLNILVVYSLHSVDVLRMVDVFNYVSSL